MTDGVRVVAWPVERLGALLAEHQVVVCFAGTTAGSRGSEPLVREMLGAALGVAPERVPIERGAGGKPYLSAGAPRLHFSVSHSDELLAVAMSTTWALGVDVERVRLVPEWQRVARRVFDGPALHSLGAELALGADAARAFMRHWCRNEAKVKATGAGLFGRADRADAGAPRVMDLPAIPIPTGDARYHAALAIR